MLEYHLFQFPLSLNCTYISSTKKKTFVYSVNNRNNKCHNSVDLKEYIDFKMFIKFAVFLYIIELYISHLLIEREKLCIVKVTEILNVFRF